MTSPNRLLAATDLSARSDRAVERAVSLAGETGSALTVLHVVDEDLPSRIAERLREAAEQSIGDHLQSLPAGIAGGIEVAVRFGRSYEAIIRGSEDLDATLVVLGRHHEDVLRDLFLGSTPERVIRRGNRPVLLVKDRAAGPYRRVMVGLDFSVYSRRAIEFALRLVPRGEFSCVHAYDVPFRGFLYSGTTRREVTQKHEAEMKRMLEHELATFMRTIQAEMPPITRIMREGSVREVVREEVERRKPDLLVIGTHGRTGAAHALLGSVAEDLLGDPPCDVLAVKAW
jgi:nucleotide-binding universal stress UspA family protein